MGVVKTDRPSAEHASRRRRRSRSPLRPGAHGQEEAFPLCHGGAVTKASGARGGQMIQEKLATLSVSVALAMLLVPGPSARAKDTKTKKAPPAVVKDEPVLEPKAIELLKAMS